MFQKTLAKVLTFPVVASAKIVPAKATHATLPATSYTEDAPS